jgi:hypothetical protein
MTSSLQKNFQILDQHTECRMWDSDDILLNVGAHLVASDM